MSDCPERVEFAARMRVLAELMDRSFGAEARAAACARDLEAIREAVERANARGEDEVFVLLPETGRGVWLRLNRPADPADVLDDEGVPS